jgi:hypothetical protein
VGAASVKALSIRRAGPGRDADDLVLVGGAHEGEDGQVDPGERAAVVEAQRRTSHA